MLPLGACKRCIYYIRCFPKRTRPRLMCSRCRSFDGVFYTMDFWAIPMCEPRRAYFEAKIKLQEMRVDNISDAIKFANDRNWHIGDSKARRRYLVSCFYTLTDRQLLEQIMVWIIEASDHEIYTSKAATF